LLKYWQVRTVQPSVRIETEVLELARPAWGGITQALDINAARQATFDGCLHELRSKERKLECQIDLAQGASFALSKLAGVSD
jgi:hypothetical protein